MGWRRIVKTVYVVHMFRWGDEELHSYVHCVCETEAIAKVMGDEERMSRANKYEPKILAFEMLDKPVSRCVECNLVFEGKGWYCAKHVR